MTEMPANSFGRRRFVPSSLQRLALGAAGCELLFSISSCKTRSFQGRLQSSEGKAQEYIHWVPGAEGQNKTWDEEKAERTRLLNKLVEPTLGERIKQDIKKGDDFFKALWGFEWQRDTPVGYSGLPLVVFRAILEDAKKDDSPFRSIWADPTWYGLTNHPDDFDDSGKLKQGGHRPLPLGMGWTRSPIEPEGSQSKIPVVGKLIDHFNKSVQSHAVQRAFISCGACHTGRVAIRNADKSYSIDFMYGAPSTEYDQTAFGQALADTLKVVERAVKSGTVSNLAQRLNAVVDDLAAKEKYFPYGESNVEAMSDAIWKNPLYLLLKDKATKGVKDQMKFILEQMPAKLGTRDKIVTYLDNAAYKKVGQSAQFSGSHNKAPPFNGESPGQLDAFGFGGAIVKVTREARGKQQTSGGPAVFKKEREGWSKLANFGEQVSSLTNKPDQSMIAARVESYFAALEKHDDSSETAEPIVPRYAAKVDPSSIWGEREDLRGQANWDGNQRSAGARALSTSLAIVANPAYVDVKGSKYVASYMAYNPVENERPSPGKKLPRYPSASAIYPFGINNQLLVAGQRIFETKCYTCHHPKNTRVYPVDPRGLNDQLAMKTNLQEPAEGYLGTDPMRAIQITTPVRNGLLALWNLTCQGDAWCSSKEEDDSDVFRKRGDPGQLTGYVAAPLDGIWARAPYLHNGSVPSLRLLLIPEERDTVVECGAKTGIKGFWRGNIDYDTANLGFQSTYPPFESCDPDWEKKKLKSPFEGAIERYPTAARSARIFDYTLEGNSNKGHTGVYLGAASKDGPTDWKNWTVSDVLSGDLSGIPEDVLSKKAADALIEYMKTL